MRFPPELKPADLAAIIDALASCGMAIHPVTGIIQISCKPEEFDAPAYLAMIRAALPAHIVVDVVNSMLCFNVLSVPE